MAGDSRLMDSGFPDDVVDLPLAVAQRFDDAAAGLIGECFEGINMHYSEYTY